jgi:hypothetical protein
MSEILLGAKLWLGSPQVFRLLLRVAVVDRVEGEFAVVELGRPLTCQAEHLGADGTGAADPHRLWVDPDDGRWADLSVALLSPDISDGDWLILQLDPIEPCRVRAATQLRARPALGTQPHKPMGEHHGTR